MENEHKITIKANQSQDQLWLPNRIFSNRFCRFVAKVLGRKGKKVFFSSMKWIANMYRSYLTALISFFSYDFCFLCPRKTLSLVMVLRNACIQCTVHRVQCTNMNWMREHDSKQYLFAMSKYNRNRSKWTWFWFYQVGQCLVWNLKWKRCHVCTDCIIILHETRNEPQLKCSFVCAII